jgi:hypothetical protein
VSATYLDYLDPSPFKPCYGQWVFGFDYKVLTNLRWQHWIENGICDSYMGMTLRSDEGILYVLTPDSAKKSLRISFFEPENGGYKTSYFLYGADFYNGDSSYSYHIKSFSINAN